MGKRMSLHLVQPEAYKAMMTLESFVQSSGLEKSLLELVKIRASQLNGCAYCLNMHTKDAREAGEEEHRLYTLSAWRDTPYFTEREKAALALTEAVTQLRDGHVSDEVYQAAAQQFTEPELGVLIMAIVAINGWNRISITTGLMPAPV